MNSYPLLDTASSALSSLVKNTSEILHIDESIDVLRPVLTKAFVTAARFVTPVVGPSIEDAFEYSADIAAAGESEVLASTSTPFLTATHFCDAISRFSTFETTSGIDAFPTTSSIVKAIITLSLLVFATIALVNVLLKKTILKNREKATYMVDFAVFKDFRPEWTVSAEEWARRARRWFNMEADDINFTRKILERSGIGQSTHFPPGIAMFPPDISIASARYEAEIVMFGCIDKLLRQNNVNPKDIDILVVNCSLFNPTPSLAAMIINHYKLRSDIVVYNLAGMGCSASPIAIDLASDLLKVSKRADPLAIVVSMENITQNIYLGHERAMMVANSLFRMGGAAVLLARNPGQVGKRPAPRYKLSNLVRLHMGSDTSAYTCVFQDVDKENKLGVRLDKSLMAIAAKCLEKNMAILGPQILPIREMVRYGFLFAKRWVAVKRDPEARKRIPVPVPDFRTAVQHLCIHAGGRAVIDAIQKALSLSEDDVKPSRDVLFKYGNTSSSSIWYELDEVELQRDVKKGDKVWQIAFGSGFKVNSAVWERV